MAIIALKLKEKNAGEICFFAQYIHNKMVLNAADFVNPPVLMKDFQTHITDLLNAQTETHSGSKDSYDTRDLKWSIVVSDLNQLANYVGITSKGELAIINKSGMPVRKSPQKLTSIDAPMILEVSSTVTAQMDVKCSVVDGAKSYAFEYSASLTTPDWKNGIISSGTKAAIKGLPSDTKQWIRVRATGTNNLISDWSDPICGMVK